jgi:pre-rRNA-processing protein TSR1
MAAAVHHHRSTTKQDHKPFKTKFASKSALKDAAKGGFAMITEGAILTGHRQSLQCIGRSRQAKNPLPTSHVEAGA